MKHGVLGDRPDRAAPVPRNALMMHVPNTLKWVKLRLSGRKHYKPRNRAFRVTMYGYYGIHNSFNMQQED